MLLYWIQYGVWCDVFYVFSKYCIRTHTWQCKYATCLCAFSANQRYTARVASNKNTRTRMRLALLTSQLIVDVLNPKQFRCCHCFCSCLFRISTLAFLRSASTMAAHCFRLRHNNTDAKTCVVLFHFLLSFAFSNTSLYQLHRYTASSFCPHNPFNVAPACAYCV